MRMPAATKDFEDPPEGSHIARCYRVIDLGTQTQIFADGPKAAHKVLIGFELYVDGDPIDPRDPASPLGPMKRMTDNRLFGASKRYTFSSHENSNFRKDLETWRGSKFAETDFGVGGFDISKLLGAPALLSLARSKDNGQGKTYMNIVGIMKPMRGVTVPPLENPKVFLSLEPGEFQVAVFDSLSDGLKETIRKSPEYGFVSGIGTNKSPAATKGGSAPAAHGDDMDDEIPF